MAEQIYVGTEKGLFRLKREGGDWALQASGLGDQEIEAIAAHPDGLHAIAGTHGAGLFATANAGKPSPGGRAARTSARFPTIRMTRRSYGSGLNRHVCGAAATAA